jgi:putative ABC transport system permease protein
MGYALATLWHDRSRYLPGVLAVAFSAVLIALQCGLLLGLFSITSIPIDRSKADIWVGSKEVLSVDLGQRIPESFVARLGLEGVEPPEIYIQSFAYWTKPDGGSELCIVLGSRLNENSIGAIDELTPDLRTKLTEPGAIVVDRSELGRLNIKGVGDTAEISGRRVHVVGLVDGLKSLAGPFVLCNVNTARHVTRIQPDQTVYLLAKCPDPNRAREVVDYLREHYREDMSAFTAREFSWQSRKHWLLKTKGGIAIGYCALLGLIVGAVVTSQTLYAATMASAREYGILLALGIPRLRIAATVMAQAMWVGILGVICAYPAVQLLAQAAELTGTKVLLPWELLGAAAGITLVMALGSGLFALRSIRQIEPVNLLR